MNVHFIAIGGSAMHNLAIALSRKGFNVSGSDDEIFEPSLSRLEKQGILPEKIEWNTENIHPGLDAVILGMHARIDNPELLKAKELNIPIFSYPEYLYEQSKDKIRLVIGGSHGKTTITSMLLHACKKLKVDVDYMVGAQLEGYDCMVRLTDSAKIMILEGDEYLSSPIDRRPKFHLYKPSIALLSGIAWDHINVFPTFENYIEKFDIFCNCIEKKGLLIYNEEDSFSEKADKILDYVYKVVEPGTITSIRKASASEQSLGQIAFGDATGLKIRKSDVKEQFGYKLAEFDESFKDIRKIYNSEYYKSIDIQEDPNATKKDIQEQNKKTEESLIRANEKYAAKAKELMDLINSANRLGVDYDELINELRFIKSTMGKSNISEMENGGDKFIKEKEG